MAHYAFTVGRLMTTTFDIADNISSDMLVKDKSLYFTVLFDFKAISSAEN